MCAGGMEGIDATFVINLDRSVDRMAEMARQLEAAGVPYQRFPAVDGAKVPAHELERLATPECRTFCTSSMIGCALSHMNLWRLVVERGYERVLVIEDDAALVPTFRQGLQQALRDVPPDFDVLLLGCFLLCNKDRKYAPLNRLARLFLQTRRDDRTWGTVYVPEKFAGTHCYVVSRRGAAKLLRLLPRVQGHIDMAMDLPDVRLYAVSPDLAFQRDMSESTIASFTFPKTLLPLLECVKDDKNVSLAYSLSTPMGQVAGMHVNVWTIVFVVLGLAGGARASPYLAGLLLAETVLGANVAMPAVAYGAGWVLRALLARLLRAL